MENEYFVNRRKVYSEYTEKLLKDINLNSGFYQKFN